MDNATTCIHLPFVNAKAMINFRWQNKGRDNALPSGSTGRQSRAQVIHIIRLIDGVGWVKLGCCSTLADPTAAYERDSEQKPGKLPDMA
jgi:hypothetical protein